MFPLPIVIHGPQGCGNVSSREAIARRLGKHRIFYDGAAPKTLLPDDIIFTSSLDDVADLGPFIAFSFSYALAAMMVGDVIWAQRADQQAVGHV